MGRYRRRRSGAGQRLPLRLPTFSVARTKPQFTPHVDTGDFVIVINAEKVRVTGNKALDKSTTVTPATPVDRSAKPSPRLSKHPERVIEHAVRACCRRASRPQAAHQARRSTLAPSIRMPLRSPSRSSWRSNNGKRSCLLRHWPSPRTPLLASAWFPAPARLPSMVVRL